MPITSCYICLKAKLLVSLGNEEVCLHKDDLLLINAGEPHGYSVGTRGRMPTLLIDASVFDDLVGRGVHLFDLNTADARRDEKRAGGRAGIQKYVRILLYGYLENGCRIGILEYEAYLRILNGLVNQFLIPSDDRRV